MKNNFKKLNRKILKSFIFLFSLLSISTSVFAGYSITRFDQNWCVATFPTAYVTNSFSITETKNTGFWGFTGGQTSKTLIIDFSSASFAFNPGQGTVTASGTEITINSYTITSASITVNISTSNSNSEFNTLTFNNIQIRSVSAGSGYLRRNGGTMKIDGSTSKPTLTSSWGNLLSQDRMTYSSAIATQPITSTVYVGTTDNQIIGVELTVSGGCLLNNLTATSFAFNTAGTNGSTNPVTDISTAKLYYTKKVKKFKYPQRVLFGSVNNPNGVFTITGNTDLTLGPGTYYFWLSYDIAPSAVHNNYVDAKATSVTLSGNTFTFTANPTGSRQISNNNYYSINTGNGNTSGNWSRTQGGSSCSCTPTAGNGYVYINHAITLNGSWTVDKVTVQNGGSLINTSTNAVTIRDLLLTTGTGYFTASSPWSLVDVTTNGTGTSSFATALTVTGDLDIGAGTTLQNTIGDLNLYGDLNVDGTLAFGIRNLTNSNIIGAYISGTGNITGSGTATLGVNKTILDGSNLTISEAISIPASVTVINAGSVIMQNNIAGASASTSIWFNDINSSLTMGGTSSALLNTGTLTATANPNTIIYSGSSLQSVKSTTYHNIIFRNATKTLSNSITINGDITIDLAGQLDISTFNYSITLNGNWINNSTNITPFFYRNGTVSFNTASEIQGSAISAFNNVTITSTGTLKAHATTGKFMVAGTWTNNNFFDNNYSDITFLTSSATGGSNSNSILGTDVTNFNSIIINAGKTLTLHSFETDFDGSITNNGTLNHNNGNVSFTGVGNVQVLGGTTATNTLYDVEITNPSGSLSLTKPLIINDSLILTNGLILSTATNTITLNNSLASILKGGSTNSYVSGTLIRKLATNLSSSSLIYNFPVGKGGIYYPFSLTTLSTGASVPFLTIEAFNSNAGGIVDVTTLASKSITEYWSASFTGNYNNGQVSLNRQTSLGTLNAIARSATQGGTYNNLNGSTSGMSVNSSDLTGNSLGFFLIAQKCIPPVVTNFSTPSATPVCAGSASTVTVNSTSLSNGTYTVIYNFSGANTATGNTGTMNFNTGLGTFLTSGLSNTGSTTVTITSIQTATGCNSALSSGNTATISVSGIPIDKTVSAVSSSVCSGTSTNITVASAALGTTYQLRNNADNSSIGLPVTGLGVNINLPTGPISSATTFNVLATTALTTCTALMSVTPTVTTISSVVINSQPVDQTICSGNNTTLIVAASGAVSYQWYEKKGSGAFASLTNGTGSNGTTIYSGATSASITITGATSSMNGWTYYCTVYGTCGNTNTNTVTLSVTAAGQWVGNTSTDWHDATNWCGGIPTSTTDVVIPMTSHFQPVITAQANCHDININSGASLTITSSGNLQLYGSLTVNGTYTNNSSGSLTMNGITQQTLPAITTFNLIINNANGVVLNGNVNVSGALTLSSGKINTGSYELFITNNSPNSLSSASASSYVIGNLRRAVNATGAYDFPVGTLQNYELINISLTNVLGFTNILGKFNNSDPLSLPLSNVIVGGTMVNNMLNYGYWSLTPDASITSGTYSVSLNSKGSSNSAPSATYYTVLKRHDITSAWQSLGTHNNNTQTFANGVAHAVRNNLTSFSDYGIGYGGSVLPIKMSSFTAEKSFDNLDAILNWSTESEENNDYFDVEVASQTSMDGNLNFRKIGEVKGSGTSIMTVDYDFTDTETGKTGMRYYRLKQVDFDGNFTYTDIKPVEYKTAAVTLSDLYPNPVNTRLYFKLDTPDEATANISVSNVAGQEVFKEVLQLSNGLNSFDFDVHELLNGMYLFNVNGSKQGSFEIKLQDKFMKN